MAKPLGDSVVVEQPRVEDKKTQGTVGLRKRIPSNTIAGAIPKLLSEVKTMLAREGVHRLGRPFFRFHSIHMGVEYDLEVGYFLDGQAQSQGALLVSSLPAGKNRGYQGNKALIERVRAGHGELDRWDTELGDTFACRYEVYVSDIDREPDHKKWIKEVAIKLK